MAAKLAKTTTPGIYRRHTQDCDRPSRCGCAYVVVFRDRGRQHKETYRTLAEAREGQARRRAEVGSGEYAVRRVTLHHYASEWIGRYQGTGRRGFRDETRDEYQRLLDKYALRFFPPQTRLAEIDPRQVADFIGWLTKQPSRHGGTLSDSSVHNALKPLSACLATARREGLIRHNPAADATLPHRPRIVDDEQRVRPFPPGTMELVVQLVHPRHRLMFELLAGTGVRRSELLALEGRHLALTGESPHIKVRQRVRRQRGNGLVIGALKSRYAHRDLPVSFEVADRLAALRTAPGALVFVTTTGTVLDPDNLHERVLSPALAEAGVEWAGFHTFRHTVASRLFAEGRNVVQVQRWLGHHSASFTLDTYVHLLENDLGAPLEPAQGNTGATHGPETAANDGPLSVPETGD